jgi:hypothetical protein
MQMEKKTSANMRCHSRKASAYARYRRGEGEFLVDDSWCSIGAGAAIPTHGLDRAPRLMRDSEDVSCATSSHSCTRCVFGKKLVILPFVVATSAGDSQGSGVRAVK